MVSKADQFLYKYYGECFTVVYQNVLNGKILCVNMKGARKDKDASCNYVSKCKILEIIHLGNSVLLLRVYCDRTKEEFFEKEVDIRYEIMWKLIIKAFKLSRIYTRKFRDKKYLYIVNALTDNIPPPDPILAPLIAEYIIDSVKHYEATKVLAPEALGLPLGALVSYMTGLPYAIARKRTFPAKAIIAKYKSGYEEGRYFIYGVEKGDKVLFVDDAISTGGTAKAIIEALESNGVEVIAAASAMAKPQYGGISTLSDMGFNVVRAVDVYVYEDGKVKLFQPLKKWKAEFKVPVLY